MSSNSKKNLKKPSNVLPESFSILDGLKCVPKTKNQRQLDSCLAVGRAWSLELIQCQHFGKYTELSSLFLYKMSRNLLGWTGDTGSYMKDSMASHMLFGVPPERYWPYTDKKGAEPDGFDREPSAFCYALAKSYNRVNNIRLRLDLPGISNDLLLKRIKNVLEEHLDLYLTFKLYNSMLYERSNKIFYPGPKDKFVNDWQCKVLRYDDDIIIKNPYSNIETKGAVVFDARPKKEFIFLPYEYILKGLVKNCFVLLKNDLIDINDFVGEDCKVNDESPKNSTITTKKKNHSNQIVGKKMRDKKRKYGIAGPEPVDKDFNLFGFILYDELDEDTSAFMNKYGGWISSATGNNCWITIFENPEHWGNYWKKSMKEIYGVEYEDYLVKWNEFDSSYRNTSHTIAKELKIPIKLFPCIIFLESLQSKNFIIYPLINDKKFYKEMFTIVDSVASDSNNTLQKLEKAMKALKLRWFIPKIIKERTETFNIYANIIMDMGKPFIEILKLLK